MPWVNKSSKESPLAVTAVLTCLTRSFGVQVSDRRLTHSVGDKYVLADDAANKAIIVSSGWLFAYTGLSKIGNKDTDPVAGV